MDRQAGSWGFLTNHARVLLAIARNPDRRLRDIAAACHITERTAQRIVTDLEQAGYLSRERDGRRIRYSLHLDGTLHHPAETHLPVRELLESSLSTEMQPRPSTTWRPLRHGCRSSHS